MSAAQISITMDWPINCDNPAMAIVANGITPLKARLFALSTRPRMSSGASCCSVVVIWVLPVVKEWPAIRTPGRPARGWGRDRRSGAGQARRAQSPGLPSPAAGVCRRRPQAGCPEGCRSSRPASRAQVPRS